MEDNFLKLNNGKTELVLFGWRQKSGVFFHWDMSFETFTSI